jgi:hypothetical protein
LNRAAAIKIINPLTVVHVVEVTTCYGLSLMDLTNLSFQTGAQP